MGERGPHRRERGAGRRRGSSSRNLELRAAESLSPQPRQPQPHATELPIPATRAGRQAPPAAAAEAVERAEPVDLFERATRELVRFGKQKQAVDSAPIRVAWWMAWTLIGLLSLVSVTLVLRRLF